MKIKIYFEVRAFGDEWSGTFPLSAHGWGGGNLSSLGLHPCAGSKGVPWVGGFRGLALTKCRETTGPQGDPWERLSPPSLLVTTFPAALQETQKWEQKWEKVPTSINLVLQQQLQLYKAGAETPSSITVAGLEMSPSMPPAAVMDGPICPSLALSRTQPHSGSQHGGPGRSTAGVHICVPRAPSKLPERFSWEIFGLGLRFAF